MKNILVIAKLSDHTLNENVLYPLLNAKNIDRIYVLRDFEGIKISDRITYLCPAYKYKGAFRHIVKFIYILFNYRKFKISSIIGILNSPHAYIGMFLSILTGVPFVYMTIAGHREFWLGGRGRERFNLSYFRSSSAITVTGSKTLDYLVKRGYDKDKVFILRNIPNERFLDIESSDDRYYDIVSFSRIDTNKNLILLVKAIARLKDKYTFRVAIAGDGDQLSAIKQSVEDYGVSDYVDFLGYIKPFEDKVKILSNSKIFISCSKGEGFPVSMLEAMCCGCVPVVSNVGDIVDMIEQGVNGYVFQDTDNEEEFVGYLDKLLSAPKKLISLRNEAEHIKSLISIENSTIVWDEVFTKLYSNK